MNNKDQIMDRVAKVLLSKSIGPERDQDKINGYGLSDHPRGYSEQEWAEEKCQRNAQKHGGF